VLCDAKVPNAQHERDQQARDEDAKNDEGALQVVSIGVSRLSTVGFGDWSRAGRVPKDRLVAP
jgi:hypothetical protein